MYNTLMTKRHKQRIYDQRYRLNHPKQVEESKRAYRASHKEEISRYKLRYRKQNRDLLIKRDQIYRGSRKELINIRSARRRESIKFRILELLGGKCQICGFDDLRAIQVDHVHGNGQRSRILLGHHISYNINILHQIQNGSRKFQLLCANHNWIKRYTNRESRKGTKFRSPLWSLSKVTLETFRKALHSKTKLRE